MSEINRQQRRAAARELPPRPILERLAERAETTGCDRCGARFGDLLPYYIARSDTRTWGVRCGDCLDGVTPVAVGAGYTGGDPWSQDDRAWFVAHPTRRWRLREPWPGEQTAVTVDAGEAGHDRLDAFTEQLIRRGLRVAIAVFQPAPGKRARHPVGIPTADPLDSFTDAGILALVPALAATAAVVDTWTDADWRRESRERDDARIAALKIVVAPS
jgi:hypothetical protein